MAKKAKQTSRPAAAPAAKSESRRFLRYCMVLALAGFVLLLWVSLLSYSPKDPPAGWVWPVERPVGNAAGLLGSHVAYALRYWLGGGVYMGLLFTTVAAVILVCGGRIGDTPWRIAGVGLLIIATSSAAFLLNPTIRGDIASGPAGVLGTAVGGALLWRLSQVGSWLVVIVALCTGLMLAADNLVLRLPGLGRKAWARRKDLAGVVRALRPGRDSMATADARCVTASPRPVAAIPVSTGKPAKPEAPKETPSAQSREPQEQEAEVEEPKARSRGLLPFFRGRKQKSHAPADEQDQRAEEKPKAGDYVLPPVDVLADPSGGYMQSQEVQAAQKRMVLQQTLSDFGVEAEVVGHMTGPVITLFELSLARGVKVSLVSNLANDIARALAVPGVRIVSPLPGRDTIGIEVPNLDKEIVRLKELMGLAPEAEKKMCLPLYLGKDAGGNPIVADLSGMPHLLIAGTTGSGKSVCINSITVALLMTRAPRDVRFILIDPKMVEMAAFENIPHLLCPIVNDMRRAEDVLEWAASTMDERYELLKEAGVRNVAGYNRLKSDEIYERFGIEGDKEPARIPTHLPYYIIIVDELADLIMTSSREVEGHIIRIAQKARAVGIHMILSTQRPSVNVVTGLIKSNMPCRISFRVASRQESRIVLDQNGADVLMGGGDMLFLQPGTSNLIRAQGTFVDDSEIRAVVKSISSFGRPAYNAELFRLSSRTGAGTGGQKDELFDKGVEIVLATQRGSVSLLQRRLQIGYSRASRIIDQMADAGILGEYKGSQARECLMTLEEWQDFRDAAAAERAGASAAGGETASA
ncbi:MAG: FtsK/SpoIIIE family DNA translocase [Planctomycetota bacterium]|jgi:S-DNA-T family DNA segregation ATPase FtsK/SpoIIIE